MAAPARSSAASPAAGASHQFGGPRQDRLESHGIVHVPRSISGARAVDRSPLVGEEPQLSFRFTVDPGSRFIDGQQFAPGVGISITLNGAPLGSRIADANGNFWFDLPVDQDPPFALVPGDLIAVSDGSLTKTTVVTHLQITGVDGNVISGLAETSTVQLWVWDTDVVRHVPVVAGQWSVDVGIPGGAGESAITTLGPGTGISTEELDEDGDGTQADFSVPFPRFTVLVEDDIISAGEFAPNAALLVSQDGTPIDTQGSTFSPYGDTWFGSPVDLKPGDTIVVGDGTTSKSLLVSSAAITSIEGNVIGGVADGDTIEVWVADTEVHRFVAVQADRTWAVDVGTPGQDPGEEATTTLVPGSHLGARETDADGDATQVQAWIPNPRIYVNPADGWFEGVEFPVGTPITMTINAATVVDGSLTVDENGGFSFKSETRIQPGDAVTASAGGISKSTVVTSLTVDAVSGNVISGHADGSVHLWVDSSDLSRRQAADASSSWSIDVSVPGDEDWEQQVIELVPGSTGGVEQTDEDGDATRARWRVANPSFIANVQDDWVGGDQFGQPVTVTIQPLTGESRTWTGEAIQYEEDGFSVGLQDTGEPWDLRPGQTVTVTGPEGTKTLVVADLVFIGYDVDANTVSGTTDRAGTVAVDIEIGGEPGPHAEADLGSGGAWVVDFDDADPPYDLRQLDGAAISQFDEDGDGTSIGRRILAPTRFLFSPVIQDVVGSAWPTGSDVTLTIHRDGVSPDFMATTSLGIGCMARRDTCPSQYLPAAGDENVFFNLSIGPFQARAGDVMTMTNGTITKELIVPDISVGLGEDDVLWADDDADRVWVPAPRPDLGMDPQADRVWVSDLPTSGDVTVTITRGGTTVHEQTVQTRNVLTRGEWLLDMWDQPTGNVPRPAVATFDLGGFDLQGGDVVTASDGTHGPWVQTVANLTVDRINPVTDTVSGTADRTVMLHLGAGEGGWWGYQATPDANGDWSFVFDETQFPWQGIDPGDVGQAIIDHSTIVFWTVGDGPDGDVSVTADDQQAAFGAALPTLTWTPSDPDVDWTTEPTCTTPAVVGSPVGTYPITCSGGVAHGYAVAYVDGVLAVVPAAQSISFAPFTDPVIGTAPLALQATATSGLPVTFTTSTPAVCTITGKKGDRLSLLVPGTCTVVADQAGNGSYLAAPTVPQTFTILRSAATITIASDLATTVFGQAVRFTAIVAGAPGQPLGTVTFTDGSTVLVTQPLTRGKATLTIGSLGVGQHEIVATYSGDTMHGAASATLAGGVNVTKAATKVTITNAKDLAKKSTRVGDPYLVAIRVVALAPGNAIPSGTVRISDGAVECTATLDANGAASCSLTPTAAGTMTITVDYGGDPTVLGSTATATHRVVSR